MKLKILFTICLIISGVSSYAEQMYLPGTSFVVFDSEDIVVSGDCPVDSVDVSVNDFDSSLDLIYTFLDVYGIDRVVCQIKFPFTLPAGYKMDVSSSADIGLYFEDRSTAVLQHSIAGTTLEGTYLTNASGSIGVGVLSATLEEEDVACNPPSATTTTDTALKTIVNLIGREDTAYMTITSGSLGSNDPSVHYGFVFSAVTTC